MTCCTSIINKARQRGLRVVGWYLPTFADPAVDQAHLAATADLGVDGIGVDIESTATELGLRNQRLIDLSNWLRATYPAMPLSAIVLPPVVTEILNLNYWPQFPWKQISTSYDVWMPMSYWTNRTVASGWRDGYVYTRENIDRVRTNLGNPTAPCTPSAASPTAPPMPTSTGSSGPPTRRVRSAAVSTTTPSPPLPSTEDWCPCSADPRVRWIL
ncbi:MAG: hypothetical protein V9G12_04905 [Microthrixaceae bacterium]